MNNKLDFKLINQIREEISIKEIIESYISLSKKGNNYWAICPFHSDQNASLSVSEQKKVYKCFSCSNGGDVFTFVKNFEKITYPQAVLKVAKIANLDPRVIASLSNASVNSEQNLELIEINETANKYFQLFLTKEENVEVLNYILSRGLSKELIKKFDIGYAPKETELFIDLISNRNDIVKGAKKFKLSQLEKAGIVSLYDNAEYSSFFKNRIMFAIRDEDNQVIGFSGRSFEGEEPKYKNTSSTVLFNKNEVLYNLNNVVNETDVENLYLVEGFMDAIALYDLGFRNVVATMGVAFTANHLNSLSRLYNLKNIIICFDNDDAGQKSIARTADIIKSKYKVYIVKYPECDCKDIDELKQKDRELAITTLNNIINYDSFKLHNLIDNSKIMNEADKSNLITKIVELFNNYNDEYLLHEDIDYAIAKLNLRESFFKDICVKKTSIKKNVITKNNLKPKNEIEFKSSQKRITPLKYLTDNTEKRIIEFCIANRASMEMYNNNFGKILNPENEKILLVIESYYSTNPEVESLRSNAINSIECDEELKLKILSIVIKVESMKLTYAQDKLQEIIDKHNSKLRTHEFDKLNKKIIEAEKKGDAQEVKRLSDLAYSIINKRN
ncbi:MAG: DNA primase [Mycoplasma sp.]